MKKVTIVWAKIYVQSFSSICIYIHVIGVGWLLCYIVGTRPTLSYGYPLWAKCLQVSCKESLEKTDDDNDGYLDVLFELSYVTISSTKRKQINKGIALQLSRRSEKVKGNLKISSKKSSIRCYVTMGCYVTELVTKHFKTNVDVTYDPRQSKQLSCSSDLQETFDIS